MSMANVLTGGMILLLYYTCYNYVLHKRSTIKLNKDANIYAIATKSLEYCGCYNNKLYTSVKTWIYSIHVHFFRNVDDVDSPYETVLTWFEEFCHDPDGIIYDAIQSGYTQFLQDLEVSRQLKRRAVFSVSSKFDYRQLPSTFYMNDYIQAKELVVMLDDLVRGGN